MDNEGPHQDHSSAFQTEAEAKKREFASFENVVFLQKKARTKNQMLKEQKYFEHFMFFEEEFVNPYQAEVDEWEKLEKEKKENQVARRTEQIVNFL